MAKNFYAHGETVNYTATSDVVSGQVIVLGGIIGIAHTDIKTGEEGALGIEGVYELAKTTGTAYTLGQRLQWDVSANKLVGPAATPAAGDIVNVGIVYEAALSAATTAKVKINVAGGTITA